MEYLEPPMLDEEDGLHENITLEIINEDLVDEEEVVVVDQHVVLMTNIYPAVEEANQVKLIVDYAITASKLQKDGRRLAQKDGRKLPKEF